VDKAGEFHTGNVAGTGKHALEIPDGFLRLGEMLGKKTTAILLGEEAVETPQAVVEGADIEDIHHQQVAGLGALDTHGPERKCTLVRSTSRTSSALSLF